MHNHEALVKIFYRPRQVFTALIEKRSWVGIGILITVLSYTEGITLDVTRYLTRHAELQITTSRLVPINQEAELYKEIESGEYDHFDKVTVEPHDSVFLRVEAVRNKTLKDVMLPFGSVLMVWWGFLGLLIVIALDAAYFRIVSSLMKLQIEFPDWLAFSIWSRVPTLCVYLIVTVLIGGVFEHPKALYGAHFLDLMSWVSVPDIKVLNIGSITFDYFGLGLAWVLVLQVIGFNTWTRRNISVSSLVVLLPTVTLYGGGLVWWMVQ